MIDFKLLHLIITLLVIVFIIILVFYIKRKKFDTIKGLVINSFIDALTFNSGLIILLYLAGLFFQVKYLSEIDNYALYSALLLAGFIMLADVIDKLRETNKNKEDGKKRKRV